MSPVQGQETERSPAPSPQCVHYWQLPPPSGPLAHGVCRKCGAERTFLNNPDAAETPELQAWRKSLLETKRNALRHQPKFSLKGAPTVPVVYGSRGRK